MELTRPAVVNSWHAKLVVKAGKKFRSDKQYSEAAVAKKNKKEQAKLQKRDRRPATTAAPEVNELGERVDWEAFGGDNAAASSRRKTKKVDHGDMMHRLAHHDSFDSLLDKREVLDDPLLDSQQKRRRRQAWILESEVHGRRVASLPDELWKRIAYFLDAVDAANLALTSKTLHHKLGRRPFDALDHPDNKHRKHAFLRQFDEHLPDHLLCFPCGKFHKRLQPGKEQLKIQYHQWPVFACPNVKASVLPRMRLAHGRELPYSFVQLAVRHATYHPTYGIEPRTLDRRWKCKDSGWTHQTRYIAHDGRLLLRVTSQTYTPPATHLTETAERHLLYDREEFTPFFSVCAHWKDGDLMKICKCMMSHVPAPPETYRQQINTRGFKFSRSIAHPDFIVRGCDECRPARRCPECPTEYLVEIQMKEDPNDKIAPFKHAIVVTRWSDLGDGSSPYTSPEWAAINGIRTDEESGGFDSFTNVGRRAVGGIFESHANGAPPGQRLISLNPSNKKLGEEGHGWY